MPDVFELPPNFCLVSGGQTGADLAGLDWAISHGVRHAGWCPKGRRSENGVIDARYALTETPRADYLQRTEWNVRDSNATIIFTLDDTLVGGSGRTAQFAQRMGKPWLHFRPGVHPKFLARFLARHNVTTLNIAGRRESASPGVYAFVLTTMDAALVAPGP